jgi:hypothetical protein
VPTHCIGRSRNISAKKAKFQEQQGFLCNRKFHLSALYVQRAKVTCQQVFDFFQEKQAKIAINESGQFEVQAFNGVCLVVNYEVKDFGKYKHEKQLRNHPKEGELFF